MKTNRRIVNKVREIYERLDSQTRDQTNLAGVCRACGKCCDFGEFDHRLFVTPPELMYLSAKMGAENIMPMPTSRCPYNIDGKCTVYEHRFAGCRIFCCKGDADFQSKLSESALEELKALCTELEIPYRYTELAGALNSFARA